MNEALKKAEDLLEQAKKRAKHPTAKSHLELITFHTAGYAEPGYQDPESGVIATGNWNDISEYVDGKHNTIDDAPAWLCDQLEEMDVEIEWSDEWERCEDCAKLVRTTADSYRWQRAWAELDDDVVCVECLTDGRAKQHLENLEGNSNACNTIEGINPEDHDYIMILGDQQNGLYGGQNDDPQSIAKVMHKMNITRFLFNLDDVDQFDSKFSLFVHQEEVDEHEEAGGVEHIQRTLLGNTKGPDPAEAMRKALQSAPIAASHGPGVTHIELNENEPPKVRSISPEQFLKGIANCVECKEPIEGDIEHFRGRTYCGACWEKHPEWQKKKALR